MLTCVLAQTKVHLWACGSSFASFRKLKMELYSQGEGTETSAPPNSSREKDHENDASSGAGQDRMGMKKGLWHPPILLSVSSRITYYVSIKSQVQSIFASFQDSNLLEGSADWRSPPLPTAMVGLQHSWAEAEWMAKQRFPLAAPPADPVSATYRHPSLSYQCLFLPTTLPVWAEKGLPRFFGIAT